MTKEKAIEEILDGFNFEKVHKVMMYLNWIWVSTEGVPEIYDLRKQARELLNRVSVMDGHNAISTGGFEAGHNSGGLLYLKFNLTTNEEEYKK